MAKREQTDEAEIIRKLQAAAKEHNATIEAQERRIADLEFEVRREKEKHEQFKASVRPAMLTIIELFRRL